MRKINNSGRISLAALLVVTVAVMVGGVYFFAGTADAGVPTGRRDTLSTSAESTASNHTIQFTLPAGEVWAAGETVILNFDDEFNTTGFVITDPLDYDITVAGTEELVVAGTTCGAQDAIEVNTVNTTTDTFTFTACGSYTAEAAASIVIIEIGTNATSPTQGDTQITNPPKTGNTECTNNATVGGAAICEIVISGTAMGSAPNSGSALVAIVEGVAVSVTVAETMTFAIDNQDAANCTGDSGTPTIRDINSDPSNQVRFGTIIADNSYFVACQNLQVTTNASNGYSVTAQENRSLQMTGSIEISDTDCDDQTTCASGVAEGGTWAETDGDDLGFGYACQDVGVSTDCYWATGPFTSTHRRFACTGAAADCTPDNGQAAATVMTNNGAVNGNVGKIHYKLSVGVAQTTGEYSNTVTYIATGRF